jgi:hypothetical protein
MLKVLYLTIAASVACAPTHNLLSRGGVQTTTPVGVVSHHRKDVDVYLLCGTNDAVLLGVIPPGGFRAFEIPAARRLCAVGLNFFLVVRQQNKGYWVGPLYPSRDSYVRLVVEKYAGLSTANVQSN